jgi:mannitol 2-dehydrogenase
MPQDSHMAEALRPQDLLYTLVERDVGVENVRVVGCVRDYLHAPSDPEAVLSRLSDPDTQIASLTVTEGGYYQDDGTGELQQEHPNLRHDLEQPDQPPVSVYGYLTEAVDRRRKAGTTPFTVLSCDNLQSNGEVAKRMLTTFAGLRDPELGRWIEQNVAFPNCMVDRITPATTDLHREQVREHLGGVEDAWPVVAEPFRQWVVEDHFCNGRPALESVGVQMTGDVLPYELMKIRMLNASHQALVHFGILLGYQTADEAMQDEQIRTLCERYMDTVRPLINEPPGVSLVDYQRTLIKRFANPAVKDQLSRIAFYASSGMPKFVLPSLRDQLSRGGSVDQFALVVAAWIRFLGGKTEDGTPTVVLDPMKEKLLTKVSYGNTDPTPFLGLREVFGEELAGNKAFATALRAALESLYQKGSRATLDAYLGKH